MTERDFLRPLLEKRFAMILVNVLRVTSLQNNSQNQTTTPKRLFDRVTIYFKNIS